MSTANRSVQNARVNCSVSIFDEQDIKRISYNLHSVHGNSAPHHAEDHVTRHISGGADPFTSSQLIEAKVKRWLESGGTTLTAGAITDGEYLKRTGSTIVSATIPAADFETIDIVTADTTVVSTAAETNLYAPTITGGTLGTANTLMALIQLTDFDLLGSDNVIYRMKFGNTPTTIAALTITEGTAGDDTNNEALLLCLLHGDGATNAQYGSMTLFTSSAINTNFRHAGGTATIDSTTNQTFAVTADYATSNATNSTTLGYVIAVKMWNAA